MSSSRSRPGVTRSARTLRALGVACALASGACGELLPLDALCEPATSLACECPGALPSVRVCRFDGTYSACLCGSPVPEPPFVPGGGAFLDAGLIAPDAGVAPDAGARDAGLAADGGARDGGIAPPDAGTSRVTYRAYAFAGGLDRIFIYKVDTSRNLCTVLILVSPSNVGGLAITTPMGWAAERGYMTDRASDCATPPMAPQGRFVALASGEGVVAFELNANGSVYPCTLDLRVSVRPSGGMGWPPRLDTLEALGVRVEGLMCP